MATFDQLSDQQRAIIELILRSGQTYDELADKLGLPENRGARAGARRAVELAPVTAKGVEADWRGQLADYVLGQQAGPESTATRGHLRRSEAARSWTRSLLDSLDTFYANGLPAIPEGDARPGARPRAARAAAAEGGGFEREPSRPLSPEARKAVLRRRLVAAGGVLAVILVAVLLWPLGVLTGGDDDERRRQRAPRRPRNSTTGEPAASGTGRRGRRDRAAGRQAPGRGAGGNLPATKEGQAYEVWLYNSPQDAKSMGAQVTDEQGPLPGRRAAARATTPGTSSSTSRSSRSTTTARTPASRCCAGKMPKLKKRRRTSRRGAGEPWAGRAAPARELGAGAGGSSLPGFMIPAGSSRSLAARSTSTPSSPISARSHGRVVATDRVVVGDRAAAGHDRVRSRGLGRPPLVQRRLRLLAGHEREVQRRA